MKYLTRNAVFKVLTLFLFVGMLFLVTGCAKLEEHSDEIPTTSMKYDLVELDYPYNSLEPYIDATTMEIHYTKHYNNYRNNLNLALEKHPEVNLPIEELLANLSLIPIDIREAVRNNGGGYYNHKLYFSLLKINHGQTPTGQLELDINHAFGSFVEFKEQFSNAASTHFGSGWTWLIVTNEGLKIVSTSNQDTPLDVGVPILCIDVWEHAYYLNYQNRRSDYVFAFFDIINWDRVNDLYKAAKL